MDKIKVEIDDLVERLNRLDRLSIDKSYNKKLYDYSQLIAVKDFIENTIKHIQLIEHSHD